MSLITYEVSTIQLKNKKGKVINAELKEFSVTLPYDLIHYIYSFMPKHPLVEIVTTGIINVKIKYFHNNEYYSQTIKPVLKYIFPTKFSKIRWLYNLKQSLNDRIKQLNLTYVTNKFLSYESKKANKLKNNPIQLQDEILMYQQKQLHSYQIFSTINLFCERNILPEYTRDKKRKKVGTKAIFIKSQKDYFKRKGIKKYNLIEHQKKIKNSNKVSIIN